MDNRPTRTEKCAVADCDRATARRQWCNAHYRRFLTYGTPTGGPKIMYGEPAKFIAALFADNVSDDCIIWPFARDPKGYGRCSGHVAHRLVCERRHGPAPSRSHLAAHSCGNGHLGCVNPAHVEWKLPKQNTHDKKEHGTWGTKLTEQDVILIRELLPTTRARVLAERFGVLPAAIYEIKNRTSWAWLP